MRINEHDVKSQNERRTLSYLTYWALCVIPLWVSCQSSPAFVVQALGPRASAASISRLDFSGKGFLKVFSATETRHVGTESTYYPHADYIMYNTNGSVFRWVENSLGPMDEAPALVELPAGPYRIRAQDAEYGRVVVPVCIEPWRTAKVYLETRAIDSSERLSPSNSVRLPEGRIVGSRAREHSW
jgi:hypothetical protein